MRPKVVWGHGGSLLHQVIGAEWAQYIDAEPWQPDRQYARDTVFWQGSTWPGTADRPCPPDWPGPCVVENFDSPIDTAIQRDGQQLIIASADYSWIWCSAEWQRQGQNEFFAAPGGEYFALCLIKRRKPWRDQLWAELQPWREHSLFSYVEQGWVMPDDVGTAESNPGWSISVNPAWYNRTQFSIVVETAVSGPRFVSEKSYKPIAAGHAWVTFGSAGLSDHLKSQGFDTLDWFIRDVSDLHSSWPQRRNQNIQAISDLWREYSKNNHVFSQPRLLAALRHNHNHFYHSQHRRDKLYTTLIQPVLEFIHA